MFKADSGEYLFLPKGFHDRSLVISQKSLKVQNCPQAVGVDDFKPLISDAPDAVDWGLHTSGSIFIRGSNFSRFSQSASSSAR